MLSESIETLIDRARAPAASLAMREAGFSLIVERSTRTRRTVRILTSFDWRPLLELLLSAQFRKFQALCIWH